MSGGVGYPTSPPDATVARLSAQIEALRGEVVPRLERIEIQVDKTNGKVESTRERVTSLELQNAHDAGVHEAEGVAAGVRRRSDDRSWGVRMLALTVVGSIVSGLTVALVLILITSA